MPGTRSVPAAVLRHLPGRPWPGIDVQLPLAASSSVCVRSIGLLLLLSVVHEQAVRAVERGSTPSAGRANILLRQTTIMYQQLQPPRYTDVIRPPDIEELIDMHTEYLICRAVNDSN